MYRYLFLLLFLSTSLVAQQDLVNQPLSRPTNTCGRWGLGVDVVGWQPMHCPYAYAQLDDLVLDIQAGYEAGFRLNAHYYRDCNYLKLSYLWYDECRTKLNTADNIFIPAVPGDYIAARGELFFRYQNVDLRWGQYVHKSDKCTFDLFATARYARIDHTRSTAGLNENLSRDSHSYVIPARDENREVIEDAYQRVDESWVVQKLLIDGLYRQKARFEGGGIGLGYDAQWNLWCWFGMRTELAGLALIGERKTLENLTKQPPDGPFEVRAFHKQSCVIPEIDARVGLNYTWYANALTVFFEVGYELNYFWGALPLSGNLDKNTRTCRDIGFAGPYGRALIRF